MEFEQNARQTDRQIYRHTDCNTFPPAGGKGQNVHILSGESAVPFLYVDERHALLGQLSLASLRGH